MYFSLRALHESHFICMLRRLKAPTVGKNGLNRSFISINSLIPCVFALPKSEIIFRAKVTKLLTVSSTAFLLQRKVRYFKHLRIIKIQPHLFEADTTYRVC